MKVILGEKIITGNALRKSNTIQVAKIKKDILYVMIAIDLSKIVYVKSEGVLTVL